MIRRISQLCLSRILYPAIFYIEIRAFRHAYGLSLIIELIIEKVNLRKEIAHHDYLLISALEILEIRNKMRMLTLSKQREKAKKDTRCLKRSFS